MSKPHLPSLKNIAGKEAIADDKESVLPQFSVLNIKKILTFL